MENISYHVASGALDKDLLFEVISSIISEPEINEEIKLKVFEAMSNHENECQRVTATHMLFFI